jgi:predicted methyltransferase
MKLLREKTLNILKDNGVKEPKFVTQRDFTKLIFTLVDPITENILKTYEFTQDEFRGLSTKEKSLYRKNFKEVSIFNETEYKKQQKRYVKNKEKFDVLYEETYESVRINENVTEKEEKTLDEIMEFIYNELSVDECNKEFYEEEILEIIKKRMR